MRKILLLLAFPVAVVATAMPSHREYFTIGGEQKEFIIDEANSQLSTQSFVIPESQRSLAGTGFSTVGQKLTFRIVGPEERYTYLGNTIVLYSDGAAFAYISLPGDWNIEEPYEYSEEIPDGEYECLFYGKYVDETNSVDAGNIALRYDINVSAENTTVTFDLEDAVNRILIDAETPEGNPYPLYDTSGMLYFCYNRVVFATFLKGYVGYPVLTNDFGEALQIGRIFDLTNRDVPCAATWALNGPFTGSVEYTIDKSCYSLIETTFDLTESEKEYSPLSYGVTYNCFTNKCEYMIRFNPGTDDMNTHPKETLSAYVVFQDTENSPFYGSYAMFSEAVGNYEMMGMDLPYEKSSGMFTNGGYTITPPNVTIDDKMELSYFSPYSIFNIDVDPKVVDNFSMSLIGNLRTGVMSEDNVILGIMPQVDIAGPYNESISLFDGSSFIKSLKINNEAYRMEDVIGVGLDSDTEISIEFEYPDAYVSGIRSPVYAFQKFVPGNNIDGLPPYISAYTIKDREGKVKNAFKEDETGAVLYFIIEDYNNNYDTMYDTSISISLSPQDKEDWQTMNFQLGCTEVSLDDFDITANEWYKVRVEATDSESNQSIVVLNNCFIFGEASGIERVGVSGTGGAVYYNLQGQRVENPGRGLYIKVEGDASEKVMLR